MRLQREERRSTARPGRGRRSSGTSPAACPAWRPSRCTSRRRRAASKRTIFDAPWAASIRSSVTSHWMSAPLCAPRPRRAAAEEIAEEALAEDVAEGLEDVADVVEVRRAAAFQAGEAVAIVAAPASPDG